MIIRLDDQEYEHTGKPLYIAPEPQKDTREQPHVPAETAKTEKKRSEGIIGWLKNLLGF